MFSRLALLSASALILAGTTAASPSSYQPRETFAPYDMGQAVNRYRGGDGMPGPDYWQNRADYQIHATLDPAAHTIKGEVTITYTNASPSALDVLWLQLDQNLYRPGSRGSLAQGGAPRGNTDGMTLDQVSVTLGKTAVPVTPVI
ncbi:MAG: M1 family peptidase, partial [Sphingomonas sp.]